MISKVYFGFGWSFNGNSERAGACFTRINVEVS
jgi:hypothetical protein